MKKLTIILALASATSAHAWIFNMKGDAQKAFTDNVNLTNSSPIKDDYSILNGYIQTKNDNWKIKLKGKIEKYSSQTANDNYLTDLSVQYKRTKNDDYTIGVFKQVYNGTPSVTTDTTSDNSGGRLAANFSHDFDKNTQGYFTVSATRTKYSKQNGRNDTYLATALGLEHYISDKFMVTPELSLQHISSSDSYYANNSYGPNILLSYTPTDAWELFADGNYSHTTYSNRTVSKTVRNKTVTEKEYQDLISADAGAIYSFPQYIYLTGKYTSSHNTSNNQNSAYQASIYYLGIGLKY